MVHADLLRGRRSRAAEVGDVEDNLCGEDAAAIIKQSRRVRSLAVAALIAALVVSACAAYIAITGRPLQRAKERSAVELQEAAVAQHGMDEFTEGWFRVYLNTVLRKERNTSSELLQNLPVGSRVYLVEKQGRRARVEKPTPGWTSMATQDGVIILRPEVDLGSDKDRQSQGLKTANEVHEQVAQLTRIEQTLMDTLNNFNEEILHPQLNKALGSVGGLTGVEKSIVNGASEVGHTAAQAISDSRQGFEALLRERFLVTAGIDDSAHEVTAGKILEKGFGAAQKAFPGK